MVLFSGFFRELRRSYPGAEVTLVASPPGAAIMAGSPYIDRVVTFRARPPRLLRPILMPFVAWGFIRRQLGGPRFDVAIQPRWDFDNMYAGWLAYCSGAPVRVGFAERVSERKSVFSRGLDGLYTIVLPGRGVQHESEHTNDMLRALGAEGDGSTMEVWPDQSGDASLPALLRHLPDDGRPIVALGPSGGHSELKAWPVSRFAEVARELTDRAGVHVVVLGGAEDRQLAAAVSRMAGVPVLDLAGRTSLAGVTAVLDRCALYVGNDTGLLHVAVARGLRTVSMFGSSPASLFGPRGAGHRVFWTRLPCGPAPQGGHVGGAVRRGLRVERCARCIYPTPRCMEEIGASEVADACLELLQSASLDGTAGRARLVSA